ncbi:unnamed protein product [Trifolium pratense]|uniref:Uncharacterized protein n=1 Tax=Trifolium pratense TaxID=57577 RepID=A0ACB0KN00_TRIPR|nr:unnamed protein product [Trifolium pratense]
MPPKTLVTQHNTQTLSFSFSIAQRGESNGAVTVTAVLTAVNDSSSFSAIRSVRKKSRFTLTLDLTALFSSSSSSTVRTKMVAQNFVVDLNKPLVFQVGHLGEAYEEWVHQPIVSKEGPRFFQNEVLEFLTLTVWWAIPVIWLPVVCWFVYNSIQMGLSCPHIAMMVVLGVFVWTLLEYTLHRFLFHIKTKTYWGNTLHYLLHGCHHKHPMDGLRLVFPPAATAILLFPLFNLVKLLSTPATAPAVFGGGLLGYVMYDCTHYYLHHAQPKTEVPRNLKKYHLNHHFRIQDKGFGITSSLWDKVFGTLPSSKADAKSM